MTIISPEELQRPRTAAELLPWVEQKIQRIGSTASGKRAIRFREGLAKPLVEEALPLGIFASKFFQNSPEVSIRHILGSQNYDAIIQDRRRHQAPFSFVEITQAHEGENDFLRMVALERDGHVNVLGAIQKGGTKNTGIHVEVENKAFEHSMVLQGEIGRVEVAIRRKSEKSYPPGTALLVVFDDYISIQDEGDVKGMRNRIRSLLPGLSSFRWLAVIGWSKKTFIEFDLGLSES